MYGEAGAYGVFAQPRPVRTAINTYLSGFLWEENVRFRDKPIRFFTRPPRTEWTGSMLQMFPVLVKDLGTFRLKTSAGVIHEGESVGVVGPNATGKTTFVRMLAGETKPDRGAVEATADVSYKPQYISPDFGGTVAEYLYTSLGEEAVSGFFTSEIERPLGLRHLYQKDIQTLSGGELQRVALAECLTRRADLYLIDEPSAYLDSNQRMEAARTIRRVMEKGGTSALIVDHDVYFLDLVSDTFMVFSGEPSVRGECRGPMDIREGMNSFLAQVGITFRRDTDTLRPRINKEGSRLDREQKAAGEYYYSQP
jgi:ATP-binding cassette subfamily E protein 1